MATAQVRLNDIGLLEVELPDTVVESSIIAGGNNSNAMAGVTTRAGTRTAYSSSAGTNSAVATWSAVPRDFSSQEKNLTEVELIALNDEPNVEALIKWREDYLR